MRINRLPLLLLLAAGPLAAGEYSAVSPGFSVNLSSVSTTNVAFQSSSGNIQGADASFIYGIGISATTRLGEIISQKVSSLVLVPALDFQMGVDSTNQTLANFNFYGTDGSVTAIQNAQVNRKTNNLNIMASLPVRWYLGSGANFGGFFIQGGPAIARNQQTVNLGVQGLVLSIATSLNESAKLTTTGTGYTAGLGYTGVYRTCQATFGVNFDAFSKVTSNGQSNNALRFTATWSF